MSKVKSVVRYVLILLAAVLTFLVLICAILYFSGFNQFSLTLAGVLRLPIAETSGKLLSAHELESLLPVFAFQSGESGKLETAQKHFEFESFARQRISLSPEEVASTKDKIFALDLEFQEAVKKFGEGRAVEVYVVPFVYKIKLAQWYLQQDSLHPELSNKAKQLKQKLADAENWDELASKESQDGYSSNYGGDAGWINLDEAIPEYKEQVESMPLNQVTLVYTRYGIHIVEVVDKTETEGKTYTHLREVVLRDSEFEQWLSRELVSTKTTWFLRK